jgi:hypothetical protein
MQLYVDGFNDNDVEIFKEAFHEDAWIFYVDADGKLTEESHLGKFRALGDAPEFGGRRPHRFGDSSGGRRLSLYWLGQYLKTKSGLARPPQSDQSRRHLEDHQQDRDAQQPSVTQKALDAWSGGFDSDFGLKIRGF